MAEDAAEFSLTWRRPDRPDPPALWGRHEYKSPDGTTVTYRIQEATPDMHEELLNYYLKEYFADEAMAKNLNMLQTDEISIQEYLFIMKNALEQNLSIVALEETAKESDKPEIAGAMLLAVLSSEDPEFPEFQGPCLRTMWSVLLTLRSHEGCDPLQSAPRHLADAGLWVRRDRRQRGLGKVILDALPRLCRAFKIVHFSTPFTSSASQKLALQAGFKEYSSILYAEHKNADGNPAFPGIPEKECKLMGFDIDLDDQ